MAVKRDKMVIRDTLTQFNGAGKVSNPGVFGCFGRVAIAVLVLIILFA